MRLLFKKALPVNLFKNVEISRLKEQIEKYPATKILNPVDFSELEFAPDLLVRCFNDIILIQFIDEYITPEELYFLATFSLSFKKKFEENKEKKGEVIIVFFLKGEGLTEKHREVLRVAERLFDMEGEIDIRDYEEIEEENFPNFLEHKIWYKYFAYFKRYKERGVL